MLCCHRRPADASEGKCERNFPAEFSLNGIKCQAEEIMETKKYVELDVLGGRVTCKCGVTYEGTPETLLDHMQKMRQGEFCASCGKSWATGTDERLVPKGNPSQLPRIEIKQFLEHWQALKKAMASSPSPNFSLVFCVKEENTPESEKAALQG